MHSHALICYLGIAAPQKTLKRITISERTDPEHTSTQRHQQSQSQEAVEKESFRRWMLKHFQKASCIWFFKKHWLFYSKEQVVASGIHNAFGGLIQVVVNEVGAVGIGIVNLFLCQLYCHLNWDNNENARFHSFA